MNYYMCFVILVSLFKLFHCDENLPPPCNSDIYCHGRLLHTIQMAKIYEDSKTFVDMKLKYSPYETLKRFEEFMKQHGDNPSRLDVKTFVSENFDKEGQEFEEWNPKDWKEHPSFLNKIKVEALRKWGKDLNAIWKVLGRKMKDEVAVNREMYSIIWVPNPVIVPGGRFREFYYWDSYWIVQGLLLSEMYSTVRGMLENFLFIIKEYGHIPNGGRIYYLARSQPPLLIPMIKMYVDHTRDHKFVEDSLEIMETEFMYWLTNHTRLVEIDGHNYTLAVYGESTRGPRPESYSEDIEIAEIFGEDLKKEAFYSEMKAAAESGWDFSSRWFVANATNKGNLTNIKTSSIVPVDLNSILYWNAVLLAEFNTGLNNTEKASYYTDIANKILEAVTAVLWHEEIGSWLDYDLQNSIKRDYFYPTNIAPLWTGCYNKSEKDKIVHLVLDYLKSKNILYPGGIPTTVEHTGEQWDYPNAWPPLQHIMIIGLKNTGHEGAVNLALEIAQKWVRSNYKAYNETEAMYEKYDATVPGGHGGGGEYELQEGFGWTNGIVMDLLDKYSDSLELEDINEDDNKVESSTNDSVDFNQLIAVLLSLLAGLIGVVCYLNSGDVSEEKESEEDDDTNR